MRDKVSCKGYPVIGGITVSKLREALGQPRATVELATEKGRASFTVCSVDEGGRVILESAPKKFARFVWASNPLDSYLGILYVDSL